MGKKPLKNQQAFFDLKPVRSKNPPAGQPRMCQGCGKFKSEAMYLLKNRLLCGDCGSAEIKSWNDSVKDAMKTASLAALFLIGLAACGDGGADSISVTGAQKCTITINGEEKPCHNQP